MTHIHSAEQDEIQNLLDAVEGSGLSAIQKVKLTTEIGQIKIAMPTASAIQKVKFTARIREIKLLQGVLLPDVETKIAPATSHDSDKAKSIMTEAVMAEFSGDGDSEDVPEPSEAAKKSATKRQRLNNDAIAMLRQIQEGKAKATDPGVREILQGYSGSGGGLLSAKGLSGSPYEYYTPKPVAKGVWDILAGSGFNGGKVLDPSAGMGIFAQTKPDSVMIDQVELDDTSGAINGLLNDGPTVSTKVSSFEAQAAASDDETYDAVVTNVPFGNHAMRGVEWTKDKRYQNADMQTYFLLRGLEKVRPGGFAAFIVPPSVVSGKSQKAIGLRVAMSKKAEFVGAYRLPNMIFDEAGADTITDIVVFRKHSKQQAERIAEVQKSEPGMLITSNVVWQDFTDGNYFKGVGRKYILGETVMGMGRFGEVEKVANTGTVASVAKLLKPFDKNSRIDWRALNAADVVPIVYQDGDKAYFNGASMEYAGGKWSPVEGGLSNDDDAANETIASLETPLMGIKAKVRYADARVAVNHWVAQGRSGNLPQWLRTVVRDCEAVEDDAATHFDAAMAGLCVLEIAKIPTTEAINYVETQPELSAYLARCQSYGKKRSPKGSSVVNSALASIATARKRGTFTEWWLGQIQGSKEVTRTIKQQYDYVKLDAADDMGFVSVDEMRKAIPGFDPLTDDEFCISPDGKSVMSADDYYTGNYGDFLRNVQDDIDSCEDADVKTKLIRQRDQAKQRVSFIDVEGMTFSMDNRFVPIEEKANFVNQYISDKIQLITNEKGEMVFWRDQKKPSYETAEQFQERQIMGRIVHYLNNGTITARMGKEASQENPEEARIILQRVTDRVNAIKAQYDVWCRSNEVVLQSAREALNNPNNIDFNKVEDFSPFDIEGLNVTQDRKPHGYQYGAIRQYSKKFGGILALDVGLGKTFTAIAAVQYCQSIGAKKKTIFCVPNSTLSNWRKEAGMWLKDTSDCLYVGMRSDKKGKIKYDSSAVAADLNSIRLNKHSKIFMTKEHLEMIPLRDETRREYLAYLLANDDSFNTVANESEELVKASASIAAESAAAGAAFGKTQEKETIMFFEDMGVDSLVIDEAHSAKNSKKHSSDFKSAKFIPNPTTSGIGLSMQAICWYLRSISASGDGVLALTATPITNSPLEIYSMLSLAIGEREVNALTGCTGADSFMANCCDIDEGRIEETITGGVRAERALAGIANLSVLQRVIKSACIIETPESVAAKGVFIKVPNSATTEVSVELSPDEIGLLNEIKAEYEAAREVDGGDRTEEEAIKASAFNLIRRMTKVIVDPELSAGRFAFAFAKNDADKAAKVVEKFSKKKFFDYLRAYEVPAGIDKKTLKTKVKTPEDTGIQTTLYEVPVKAAIEGGEIALYTGGYQAHDELAKLMDAAGLTVKVRASAKTLAMLENFSLELANPKWKPVKQIIFCDELALHHKLRLLVAQECGIPTSKIVIVNGQSVSADSLQEVQDGFNASDNIEGEENRYQVVIANKKAEVGINLQKGTQAIHHLSIGWTPDSIHQRNGRGVRQGNEVEGGTVNLYFYDANGTFDSYKRNLVSVKGDWIGSVMDGNAKSARIEGDIDREEVDKMANAFGDSKKMKELAESAARKAKEQVAKTVRVAQVNALTVMKSRSEWLKKFASSSGYQEWANGLLKQIEIAEEGLQKLESKANNTSNEVTKAKALVQAESVRARLDEMNSRADGIKTDWKGNARGARSEEEKSTPAYKAYLKEVELNEKMLTEAENAFNIRSVDGGYDAQSLEEYKAGRADIYAGNLIVAGTIAKLETGYGIFVETDHNSKPTLAIWSSDKGYITGSVANIKKCIYKGDPEYGEALGALVDIDEENIKSGKTDHLFARKSPVILNALRSDIPSISRYYNGSQLIRLMQPDVLPIVIPPRESDEFGKLFSDQAKYVEFKQEYNSTYLTFKSLKSEGEVVDSEEAFELCKAWTEGHNIRLTIAQWGVITTQISNKVRETFMGMIDDLVSQSGSMSEFDANANLAIPLAMPYIDFTGVTVEQIAVANYFKDSYAKARAKADNGTEKYDFEIKASAGSGYSYGPAPYEPLSEVLRRLEPTEIQWPEGVKEALLDHMKKVSAYNIFNTTIRGLGDAIIDSVMKKAGATVAGEGTSRQFRFERDDGVAQEFRSNNGIGKSAIPVVSDTVALVMYESNFNAMVRPLLATIQAEEAMKEAKNTGMDAAAIIEKLKSFPGQFDDVELGTMPFAISRTSRHGSIMLKAGTYLKLFTKYKGDFGNKISDGANGLANRHGEKSANTGNRYAWFISLVPVDYSDGKPFPTVKSLAEHLNISIED